MKRITLHLLVAILSLSCGIGTTLLWKARRENVAARERKSQEARDAALREVPLAAVVIRPQAPLSISSVAWKTQRVLNVEVMNVSSKAISGFSYVHPKSCGARAEGGGGGVGFSPEKLMRPGEKFVFEAGEEEPVEPQSIQDCIDNATRIGIQINHVDFADGTAWDSQQEDNKKAAGDSDRN